MNFKKKNAANAPAPNQAQQAARRRSLRSGAYASVLAVVVLVLVILLNLVVARCPPSLPSLIFPPAKCSP